MKKIYILIFVFLSFNLNAQQNLIYLSGIILDKESNTPLEYATISILKQKGFENLIDVAGGFGAIKKSNLNESCYSSFAQCAG